MRSLGGIERRRPPRIMIVVGVVERIDDSIMHEEVLFGCGQAKNPTM
jgi:hypothetical protein